MTGTAKILENPTEPQIDDAANVLTAAFKDEILGRSLVGGNMDLMKPMFEAMARAAALEGALCVVYDEAEKIVSAGVWFPPGRHFMATEAQRGAGWDAFFEKLTPENQQWWGKVDEEGEKRWKELVGSKYSDCWYAAFLGTDPAHQGKGYGAEMIKKVLGKAMRDDKIALLTTQSVSNARWYGKFGFKEHAPVFDFTTSQGPLEARFLIWEKGTSN